MNNTMSDIEERTTCPLGSTCKELLVDSKTGKPYMAKCAWLVSLKGTDASGTEQDDERCSMAWQPILMLENSSQQRNTAAAVTDLRDNVVDATQKSTNVMIEVLTETKQVSSTLPYIANY